MVPVGPRSLSVGAGQVRPAEMSTEAPLAPPGQDDFGFVATTLLERFFEVSTVIVDHAAHQVRLYHCASCPSAAQAHPVQCTVHAQCTGFCSVSEVVQLLPTVCLAIALPEVVRCPPVAGAQHRAPPGHAA